jgi:predicted RNA-binding Zn ribbon-like protein
VEKASNQDFQFIAGSLALDFVNTVANRRGERRECLQSAAEFNRWARSAGLLTKNETLRLTGKQLANLRAVREELYRMFEPLALGKTMSASAIARLNARLSRVAGKRQLEFAKGKVKWQWKTSSQDADRVLGPILFSASELIVSGWGGKFRQCADEFCGWVFLDRSQAGRRRWCRMADCGNRAKARWHYRRVKKMARHSLGKK